jgi:hypothetical protein
MTLSNAFEIPYILMTIEIGHHQIIIKPAKTAAIAGSNNKIKTRHLYFDNS